MTPANGSPRPTTQARDRALAAVAGSGSAPVIAHRIDLEESIHHVVARHGCGMAQSYVTNVEQALVAAAVEQAERLQLATPAGTAGRQITVDVLAELGRPDHRAALAAMHDEHHAKGETDHDHPQ